VVIRIHPRLVAIALVAGVVATFPARYPTEVLQLTLLVLLGVAFLLEAYFLPKE
jgi:hypothetical protein